MTNGVKRIMKITSKASGTNNENRAKIINSRTATNPLWPKRRSGVRPGHRPSLPTRSELFQGIDSENIVVSVVGNASSLFTKQHGDLIDEADIVIRFNAGTIVSPISQGSQTDIHVYSLLRFGEGNPFGSAQHWKITPSTPERQRLQDILDAKPSNGVVTLERLNSLPIKPNKVRLFGFDWQETTTWYQDPEGERIAKLQPELAVNTHNYEKEKEYCIQMLKDNDWELY